MRAKSTGENRVCGLLGLQYGRACVLLLLPSVAVLATFYLECVYSINFVYLIQNGRTVGLLLCSKRTRYKMKDRTRRGTHSGSGSYDIYVASGTHRIAC